jgi:large subunit ribosomal protein L18
VSILRKLQQRKARRQARVRFQLKATSTLPRISVFRSMRQIYAQLIDDSQHATLASCSSAELMDKSKKKMGDKKVMAHAVGIELAKRSMDKGIKEAVFDRGRYLFHGRVKALVEGLREGGLKI